MAALAMANKTKEMVEKSSKRLFITTTRLITLSSEIIKLRPAQPALMRWLYFHARLSVNEPVTLMSSCPVESLPICSTSNTPSDKLCTEP